MHMRLTLMLALFYRTAKLLGRDMKSLMGTSYYKLVHPADIPPFAAAMTERRLSHGLHALEVWVQ